VLVGRRGGVSWLTTVGGATAPRSEPVRAPRGVRRYWHGWIDDTAHRTVAAAIARIRAGELAKVVLARDLLATADVPLDERCLLARLAAQSPTSWVYAVAGLIGTTPELLISRERNTVAARLLAGTAWPRPGSDNAASLERELLASAKNRAEHGYGVQSLAETLAPFCTRLHVPDEPTVLHLCNISHLATDVHGTLAADTPLLDLVAQVHPTAAVAGSPRQTAMRSSASLRQWIGAVTLGLSDGSMRRAAANSGWRCAVRSCRRQPRACSPEAGSSRTPTRIPKRRRSEQSSASSNRP
jgi:menaquinone-specific isochorismate synthase